MMFIETSIASLPSRQRNMENAVLFFALCVAAVATGRVSAGAGGCGSDYISVHPKLECRIAPKGSQCYYAEHEGLSVCDYSKPCSAWTGMQLNVSCGDEDSQILFRDNSTFSSGHRVSWTFAASAAGGLYECRNATGSFSANRSVIVHDGVYLIPGRDPYHQWCKRDIVPGYNCNVADQIYRYLKIPDADEPHIVLFNVFGARPIDLNVEVVWVNHYPVDLHLSWNHTASTSTSLHSVTLNMRDLVMVGERIASLYVVITANSSYGSSTMCIPLEISRAQEPGLFFDENLPADLTVAERKAADFSCQVMTTHNSILGGLPGFSMTVAFLVRPPDSSELTQCINCSFSMTELTMCREMVDEGSCSGLQFINSSFGHPDVLTHNLTAHWSEVDMRHSGYEVVCAIAVSGITQWAHTATLTVTPATPTPTPTSVNDGKFLQERDIVLLTSGVVVLGSITGASVVGLILLYRHKRRHTYWSPASTHEDKKTFVKFEKICD